VVLLLTYICFIVYHGQFPSILHMELKGSSRCDNVEEEEGENKIYRDGYFLTVSINKKIESVN